MFLHSRLFVPTFVKLYAKCVLLCALIFQKYFKVTTIKKYPEVICINIGYNRTILNILNRVYFYFYKNFMWSFVSINLLAHKGGKKAYDLQIELRKESK